MPANRDVLLPFLGLLLAGCSTPSPTAGGDAGPADGVPDARVPDGGGSAGSRDGGGADAGGADGGAGSPGPFLELDGLLVVEAESFETRAPSTYEAYEHVHEWHLADDIEGFGGSAFMQVLPDERGEDAVGPGSPRDDSGAEMTYPIRISTPGTYTVWVRGWSMGGESNGVHVGADGRIAGREAGASNMSGFRPHDRWIWENGRKDGYQQPATLELTAGDHTLHVWSRDDAFRIDRLYLTLGSEAPSGEGPEESPRATEAGHRGHVLAVDGEDLLLDGRPFRVIGVRTSNALMSDATARGLVDELDTFASFGVNTVSVFFMGSRFGDVAGYRPDASLDPVYADRMGRIIEAADERGMVVLVGCLYWGTSRAKAGLEGWTQSDANRAVANTVRWLSDNGYRNVFVDPDNEGMARAARGWSIAEMIDSAHAVDPTIMVAYNHTEAPPANADLLAHFSPREAGRPWIESEGSASGIPDPPGGSYWSTYSKETHQEDGSYWNYSRIGRYTADMREAQISAARYAIDSRNGYIMASTWLQCADDEGVGGPFMTPGGRSEIADVNAGIDALHPDAGIRWWLEAMREAYGPWM